MPRPELAVYVLHWNAADRLALTVDSLLASSGVDVRLTVVDNGSTADVRARITGDAPTGVRVIALGENTGYTGAANAALSAHLRGSPDPPDPQALVAVAAHDTLVRPDTLRVLVDAAADRHYGILGPAHHGRSVEGPAHWMGGHFLGTAGAPFAPPNTVRVGHSGPVVPVDWLPGLLMVFRVGCLREIGLFDERLFAYWEDVDICLRAHRSGWGVGVVPEAAAADQGYSAAFFNQAYYVARNRVLVVDKHLGRRKRDVAAARLAVRALTAYAGSLVPTRSRDHRARSRAYAAGRWAGLRDGLKGVGGPAPRSAAEKQQAEHTVGVSGGRQGRHSQQIGADDQ